MEFIQGGYHTVNGGAGKSGSLCFVYEVDQGADSTSEPIRSHTHNSGDKRSLDIIMLASGHLVHMRHTIMEMACTNMFMLAAEPSIELAGTYHLLTPLQWVVEKKLMARV
jgi:hypothetical protein